MPDLNETKHASFDERVEFLTQQCILISERPDLEIRFKEMAKETISSLTGALFDQLSADMKAAINPEGDEFIGPDQILTQVRKLIAQFTDPANKVERRAVITELKTLESMLDD